MLLKSSLTSLFCLFLCTTTANAQFKELAESFPQTLEVIRGGVTPAEAVASYVEPALEMVRANPAVSGSAVVFTLAFLPEIAGIACAFGAGAGVGAIYKKIRIEVDKHHQKEIWVKLNDPKLIAQSMKQCAIRSAIPGQFDPLKPVIYIPKNVPAPNFVAIQNAQAGNGNDKKPNGNQKERQRKRDIIWAEVVRQTQSFGFWLNSFRFQSGLSEGELRRFSRMAPERKGEYIASIIPINRLNPWYDSTRARITQSLNKEIRQAVRNFAVREFGKIFRLREFFTKYQYHPEIVGVLQRIFREIRQHKENSRYALTSFDLSPKIPDIRSIGSLKGSLDRAFQDILDELNLAQINYVNLIPEARYQARARDPAIEEVKNYLGVPPAKPAEWKEPRVASVPFAIPVNVLAAAKATEEEQAAIIQSAENRLPILYAWRRGLREVRRKPDQFQNIGEILDECRMECGISSESLKIDDILDALQFRIVTAEAELTTNIENPVPTIRRIRNLSLANEFNRPTQIPGFVLDAPSEQVSAEEESGEENDDLNRQAEALNENTFPKCFVLSNRFIKQYRSVPGNLSMSVNRGVIKLSYWFRSEGRLFRNSLRVTELEVRGVRRLYRVKLRTFGGTRILFEYEGEGSERKIRLLEVGQHDDVMGGQK